MDQRKIFLNEEYQTRISKLQKLMAQNDMDGILVTQPENLIYFSGYRTGLYNSKFRPFLCFIPVEGSPTLVLPNLELGLGRQTSYIDDIRCWGGTPGCQGTNPLVLGADVIKAFRKSKSKIGIEIDNGQRMGMNMAQFDELRSYLPSVSFVPSSGPIWKLRSIKSPLEIQYMKEACRITDKAIEAAVDFIQEGRSEKEVSMVLGMTMMKEGADFPRSLSISSGVGNYDVINGLSTDRRFKKGDMINIDFGALYKGYCSDITRSVFVGNPPERPRAFYLASKQIQERACRAVRPGIPVSEVDKVAEQAIIDLGYREYMLHRTGHSLGLEVHEPPSVGPGDATVIEEGMILAIEPGIYDFSIGAFRIEDNVVVTSNGFEYLSNSTREMVIK
jgi:Xaa-Pro aminopeptidase